jgi:hypothetical protein
MDCCNPEQARLLTKPHLDIRWHDTWEGEEWDTALNMTNVRSLKGLKTLHVNIE